MNTPNVFIYLKYTWQNVKIQIRAAEFNPSKKSTLSLLARGEKVPELSRPMISKNPNAHKNGQNFAFANNKSINLNIIVYFKNLIGKENKTYNSNNNLISRKSMRKSSPGNLKNSTGRKTAEFAIYNENINF